MSVGHAPTRGFTLQFFSSGLADVSTPDYTGYTSLTLNNGNFSYPADGSNYRNNERAFFLVNPTVPSIRTLRFTRMDLESASGCTYDAVVIYNWYENRYNQITR